MQCLFGRYILSSVIRVCFFSLLPAKSPWNVDVLKLEVTSRRGSFGRALVSYLFGQ